MHRFLNLLYEWWLQLWPNMFAVSVWTSILFFWHHRSVHRKLDQQHKEHMEKWNLQLSDSISSTDKPEP